MSPDLWPVWGLPFAFVGLMGMWIALHLKDMRTVNRVFCVCRVLVVIGLLVMSHALAAAIATEGIQW